MVYYENIPVCFSRMEAAILTEDDACVDVALRKRVCDGVWRAR